MPSRVVVVGEELGEEQVHVGPILSILNSSISVSRSLIIIAGLIG